MIALANCERLPLADNSVDLIFTDPPYPKEFLPCYEWLAMQAKRVLKPGGFVLAMAGGMYLNKIYKMFDDAELAYFWEFTHMQNGDAPYIWPKWVVAKTKAIIAYSNGPGQPRIKSVLSIFESTAKSKLYHHWGQDVESARYYIDCFSAPGDLVCDPFVGGGTTPVACGLIGRRCVSFDIDLAALHTTRSRRAGADILCTLPMFESLQEAAL